MTASKICGITREQDALAAAHCGANAVGFVFYAKSPRAVTPARAAALMRVLPPFVTSVALFVDADVAAVKHTMAMARADLLQFHGDESPAYCRQFGVPYLKALRVRPGVDLLQYALQYESVVARRLCGRHAGWHRRNLRLGVDSEKFAVAGGVVGWLDAGECYSGDRGRQALGCGCFQRRRICQGY